MSLYGEHNSVAAHSLRQIQGTAGTRVLGQSRMVQHQGTGLQVSPDEGPWQHSVVGCSNTQT